MNVEISMTVKNDFGKIADAALPLLSKVVRKAALDVETKAKLRAPFDTGALRSSIKATPVSQLESVVEVGVGYGIYVEFGTTKAAAQPYFIPAVSAVRPSFEAAVMAVLSGNTI